MQDIQDKKFIYESESANSAIFRELMLWSVTGVNFDYNLKSKYSDIHIRFFENLVNKLYVIKEFNEIEFIEQFSHLITYFTDRFNRFLSIYRKELEFRV